MFYSYNVIMNKKLCLAETQKSTETLHCKEKKHLAHMNRFPLRSGSFKHRYDVYKVYQHDDDNDSAYNNMIEYKNINY